MQISDAFAPENQPDYSQLGNTTYLMKQYEEFVAGLESPLAVSGGGSVFSYNPCFVNFAPAGAIYSPLHPRLTSSLIIWPSVSR